MLCLLITFEIEILPVSMKIRSTKSLDAEFHIHSRRWPILSKSMPLFALAAFACVVSFAATTLDATRTQYALKITAPVIDGEVNVKDANEWRFAAGNSDYWHVFPDDRGFAADGIRGGELTAGQNPDNIDDLSFKVYAGFDDQNLYVAVIVKDEDVQTDTAAADSKNGNTWEDDSVEVFVDPANANADRWAKTQKGGQYVITANNAYREAEAGDPGFGANAAWFAKTARTDTGYAAEFRISLATLGNPKPGDLLGFTVAVNDDDGGGATTDTQLSWKGKPHQPVTYGNLVVGPPTHTVFKVTTPPNPDGKINLSEYPGAREIRVNSQLGVVYIPGADNDIPLTDLEYKAYAVHDNAAIYFAVDVTDEKVSTDQSNDAQMPDLPTWEDDSVELFFDVDNSKNFGGGTGLGGGVFEGQYTQTYKGFFYDGSPSKDAQKGVHWSGAGSLTATGYQVEFRIPKTSLGSPKDGDSIGFHIAVNDDDGVGDYSHIGWAGQAHHEYTYGPLVFSSQAAGGPTGDRPRLTGAYANGAFSMTLQTTAGAKYDVEYSQDLKAWQVIMPAVAGTGQAVPITETDATRKARSFGFYRARVK